MSDKPYATAVGRSCAGRGEVVGIADGTKYEIVWDVAHPWFRIEVSNMAPTRFADLVVFAGNRESRVTGTVAGSPKSVPMISLSAAQFSTDDDNLRVDTKFIVTRLTTRGQQSGEQPLVMPKSMLDVLARILGIQDFVSMKLAQEKDWRAH